MTDWNLIANITEFVLLVYIIIKSKGWDGPHLRSSIDALFRDYGFLKRKINELEIITNSNKTEIDFIKGNHQNLQSELFILSGKLNDQHQDL